MTTVAADPLAATTLKVRARLGPAELGCQGDGWGGCQGRTALVEPVLE
ncbi:hypothetical protein [Streptomyces sp. Act143]|nr:hypothetical protein [Streptomyces sp. Act143]